MDNSNTGTEDGSSNNPFNTIQEGYDLLLPSGNLKVSPGNYSLGNTILDKRMTIIADGGSITIEY